MIETVQPESVGLDSKRLDRVSEWLDAQIASQRLAGASVLISRRGQVAFFRYAGFADKETGKPFSWDTIVRIYSMSKPITSVATMILYEEGRLQLDDPLSKFLPQFAKLAVWKGGAADISETVPIETPITIHHLLTHTSGLTYGFMRANVVDAAYRAKGIEFPGDAANLQEWSQRVAQIPLLFQPGSRWNYSIATDLLGCLIEVCSGQSLEEFFKRRIFEPLGMRDTGFHVRPEHRARFAALYAPLRGGDLGGVARSGSSTEQAQRSGLKLIEQAASNRFLAPTTLFSGGGGLTSSISDYARFCQMLMNGGDGNGSRLLSRKTVEYMRKNHLPENRDMAAMGQPVWSETSYAGIGFGLGFAVVLDAVKAQMITSVGEYHWGGAASTLFWLDPLEELFVIFMTQLMPSSTYPIRRELRARVYQALSD